MANRRIEMHQYRQVIHRMRPGQRDRAIARSKLIGRTKKSTPPALEHPVAEEGRIRIPF